MHKSDKPIIITFFGSRWIVHLTWIKIVNLKSQGHLFWATIFINFYINTFDVMWVFFYIERKLTCLNIFFILLNVKLNSFLTHLCVPKKPNNILNIVREWYSAYKDIGVINLKTSLSSKFNIQCYFVVFYGSKKKRFKPISSYFIFFREEIDMYCTCQLFVTFLFYRLI